MATLDQLKHARSYIRGQVTRVYNTRDTFPALTPIMRDAHMNKVKTLMNKLEEYDCQIREMLWSFDDVTEDDLSSEMDACQNYLDRIHECVSTLTITNINNTDAPRSILKSPVAPLPKFTGADEEDFSVFLRQFEDTTGKFNYPDYDKFLILKQQLEGRAAILIDSLEVNRRTYNDAISLLKSAFAATDYHKFNIIKQLTELSLKSNEEPFVFISKVRKLTDAVKTLTLDVDCFIQYFFWTALDDNFRTQYVQLTNKTRPTLGELNDHFFEACERYKCLKKYKKKISNEQGFEVKSQECVAMAARVETKKVKMCDLCLRDGVSNVDHPIHKCGVYASPSDKLTKIKKLGGCIKCSYLNHSADRCRFRFESRCPCSEWHFRFLCTGQPKKKETRNNSKLLDNSNSSENTISKIGISISMPNAVDSNSVLPTLLCEVSGTEVRALRDLGSQLNFISEPILEKIKYKLVRDNVSMGIRGFNCMKEYITKIIELEVKFGRNSYHIETVVIPEIDIKIKLPGLSLIAKEFIDLGYTLADPMLLDGSDQINDLNLILGTRSAFCVAARECRFGLHGLSVYADTCFGVMILGDVEQIKRDLPYLPRHSECGSVSFVGQTSELACNSEFVHTVKSSVKETDLSGEIDYNVECGVDCQIEVSSFNVTVDDVGDVDLDRAADEILKTEHFNVWDDREEICSDMNQKLVEFALKNTTQATDGRITMPILWNPKVKHLLGSNSGLAKAILNSNMKKIKNNSEYMSLIDEVFKEQIKSGIIQKIENHEKFLSCHPEHSFLSHMPVFRLKRETTKCRVVFLSNLCQKSGPNIKIVSHNQAIFSGPSINQKLSSALIHLRFDNKLLCFDLKKAFNQIHLLEQDSNRLLFWWFKNPTEGDFSLVLYKNVALPFGLKCSPCLLMLCMYRLLILDNYQLDSRLINLKKIIYQCIYMDNAAMSFNSSNDLEWAYEQLGVIFGNYKFQIQQVITNDLDLQIKIDSLSDSDSITENEVKLLGTVWNRTKDTIYTNKINLNSEAVTKRQILKTIASQYDLHNFNGPLINRSRLFMRSLQCMRDIDWDSRLSDEYLREWCNICRQLNNSPVIEIKRFVGRRDDPYNIVTFTDASKDIYACVLYLHNLRTNELSFVMARNRLISQQLNKKTIPSLELAAILLGVTYSIDLYKDLSEPTCVMPINIADIKLYSDSLVCLSWLDSFVSKLDKMTGRSVFVMNKLYKIEELCRVHSVKFEFISGTQNPADCMTRCLSYKQLLKTNFIDNCNLRNLEQSRPDFLTIIVPDPNDNVSASLNSVVELEIPGVHLIPLDRYSSFDKFISVYCHLLKFVDSMKRVSRSMNYRTAAKLYLINTEQKLKFPEVFKYLSSPKVHDIPEIVSKLNVYMDDKGLLRVKCKFDKLTSDGKRFNFPILLPKDSKLTNLIISDCHIKNSHIGCYSLLSELRSQFFVQHFFSNVKKVLKNCVICKRYNARNIKINQSSYKEERYDPPKRPFAYIYFDHAGPFTVKTNKVNQKVYLLIISCMWSRAVNILVCVNLSVKEFLRAFQIHIFSFGSPVLCISDLGSSFVAGDNIITDFLNDVETADLFEEYSVQKLSFRQFAKGNSKLGSLVEVMVKSTKLLINKSIKNNIIDFRDFEYLIHNTVSLINKRPVTFAESLRENSVSELPEVITPEKLIHGFELLSLVVVPQVLPDMEEFDLSNDSIRNEYKKLRTARNNLINNYHGEFLGTLIKQSTDDKGRYKPVCHNKLYPGDIVLIKDEYLKRHDYPMAIIVSVNENSLGEVTSVKLKKGKTNEIIKRHVECVIPLLSNHLPAVMEEREVEVSTKVPLRAMRKAALVSSNKTKAILNDSI